MTFTIPSTARNVTGQAVASRADVEGAVNAALLAKVTHDVAEFNMRTDFGAVFDGVTDDAPAWNLAVSAFLTATSGIILRLPPGRSICSSSINITVPAGKSFTIQGAGHGDTDILFTGGTDGLVVNMAGFETTVGRRAGVALRGFSVLSATASGWTNCAITILNAPSVENSVVIDDMRCQGLHGVSGWLIGIQMRNVIGATINAYRWYAYPNVVAASTAQTIGLLIHGDGQAGANGGVGYAVDVHINDTLMVGGDRHIVANGWVQGLYVTNSTLIAQNTAIDCGPGAYGAAGGSFELVSLFGGTLNSQSRNVLIRNGGGVSQISGVLMQQTTYLGTTSDFASVEIDYGNYVTLVGNSFQGASGTTGVTRGVLMTTACAQITIVGNTFNAFTQAAVCTSTGADVNFTAIIIDGNTMASVGTGLGSVPYKQLVTNNTGPYVTLGTNYVNTVSLLGRGFQFEQGTDALTLSPGSTCSIGSVAQPVKNINSNGAITCLSLQTSTDVLTSTLHVVQASTLAGAVAFGSTLLLASVSATDPHVPGVLYVTSDGIVRRSNG